MKFIVLLAVCVAGALATSPPAPGSTAPGGASPLVDEAELSALEQKIRGHLTTLASSKPNSKVELLERISATSRVAAGPVYELVGTAKENDSNTECVFTLWEQPWVNFSQLTVECGPEKTKYELTVGSQ